MGKGSKPKRLAAAFRHGVVLAQPSDVAGSHGFLRATALALALGSANAGGAYPELSGGASHQAHDATFDSFINDALAAGKAAMVRWIASEG